MCVVCRALCALRCALSVVGYRCVLPVVDVLFAVGCSLFFVLFFFLCVSCLLLCLLV